MYIKRADIHIFGSPCVHDSAFGKGDKERGKHEWVLMAIARHRRSLQEPYWVAENSHLQGGSDRGLQLALRFG